MSINVKFKDRLKKLRIERDMKQKDLAKVLNYGESTISNYENGHNTPSYQDLMKIAKEFDVSLDYLLGATDIKTHFGSGAEVSDSLSSLIEKLSSMNNKQIDEAELFFKWLNYRDIKSLDFENTLSEEENIEPVLKVAQKTTPIYKTKKQTAD